MKQQQKDIGWYVAGASVKGASHWRTNQPNQDAIFWEHDNDTTRASEKLVLTLSDGHGGAKYFRSDVGARFAVETTTRILHDLLNAVIVESPEKALSVVKQLTEEQVPRLLVREWHKQVEEHRTNHPWTDNEIESLREREGDVAVKSVQEEPVIAYGATILAIAVTPAFILYLQLGDGDILVVSPAGEVARPLPADERLFANETTSLCTPQAWREVRFAVQPVRDDLLEHIPALIVLATDGYSNSFQNGRAFRQVGTDLLEMIRTDGIEHIQASMEGWLNEASQQGSGDDITLGVICRSDMVPASLNQATSSESVTDKENENAPLVDSDPDLPIMVDGGVSDNDTGASQEQDVCEPGDNDAGANQEHTEIDHVVLPSLEARTNDTEDCEDDESDDGHKADVHDTKFG